MVCMDIHLKKRVQIRLVIPIRIDVGRIYIFNQGGIALIVYEVSPVPNLNDTQNNKCHTFQFLYDFSIIDKYYRLQVQFIYRL